MTFTNYDSSCEVTVLRRYLRRRRSEEPEEPTEEESDGCIGDSCEENSNLATESDNSGSL